MRKGVKIYIYVYIILTMTYNLAPKSAKKFYCETCDFNCSKQYEWSRHCLTRKHNNTYKILTNTYILAPKSATCEHVCECGNMYKHRQSLHNHRKYCSIIQVASEPINNYKTHVSSECNSVSNIAPTVPTITTVSNELDKEMLIKLLLKNQDVMEKMIELMPQIGNQVHTNSHNTTNNQFNIQMFLNEHCKNAMNLTDFIDSLPITAATYDSTIENGLTKTLTNMITNGLSQLDILERPIHCTDATRKTIYVKEANNWEKDTELLRILLGIKTLARKQRMMINKWQDANEGWETEDYIQTKLTTLISHSMTNIESDEKETSKIVRAISKNVYLDNETKQQYLC